MRDKKLRQALEKSGLIRLTDYSQDLFSSQDVLGTFDSKTFIDLSLRVDRLMKYLGVEEYYEPQRSHMRKKKRVR